MTCAATVTAPALAMTAIIGYWPRLRHSERRKGTERLATFLIDLSPGDMQRRLGDALGVYVDAMRYPRGTEDQRASMWLEHTRRHGWKAVAAVEAPPDTDGRGDAGRRADARGRLRLLRRTRPVVAAAGGRGPAARRRRPVATSPS